MVEVLPLQSFEATALILSTEGEWLYQGALFSNERLKDFLYRSVVWDKDQSVYLIRNDVSAVVLNYEDSPYFIEDIVLAPDSTLSAKLRGGAIASLEGNYLFCSDKNSLSAVLKGGHRAKLTRGCQQRLVETVLDEDTLILHGIPVIVKPLGSLDEVSQRANRTEGPQ